MLFDVEIYDDSGDNPEYTLIQTLAGADVTWEQYGENPQQAIARDPETGQELARLKTWDDYPFEILADSIRFSSGYLPSPVNGSDYSHWVLLPCGTKRQVKAAAGGESERVLLNDIARLALWGCNKYPVEYENRSIALDLLKQLIQVTK